MNRIRAIVMIAAITVAGAMPLAGCRNTSVAQRDSLSDHAAERYDDWAQRVELPGLPNLRHIDQGLYAGAQPSSQGIDSLRQLGVKTIINLRTNDSDGPILGEGVGLAYRRIPMESLSATHQQVVEFLRIACDPDARPVFVHCQHGADRTGVLVTMYRVIVQGWSREQAIAEMTRGGTKFHVIAGNLVDFVRIADIEQIAADAGLQTRANAE